jgi:hypothetical protein
MYLSGILNSHLKDSLLFIEIEVIWYKSDTYIWMSSFRSTKSNLLYLLWIFYFITYNQAILRKIKIEIEIEVPVSRLMKNQNDLTLIV